jgi:hypothetical protein
MLDSLEGICPGQAGLEYPATSVPFSNLSLEVIEQRLGWQRNKDIRESLGSYSRIGAAFSYAFQVVDELVSSNNRIKVCWAYPGRSDNCETGRCNKIRILLKDQRI